MLIAQRNTPNTDMFMQILHYKVSGVMSISVKRYLCNMLVTEIILFVSRDKAREYIETYLVPALPEQLQIEFHLRQEQESLQRQGLEYQDLVDQEIQHLAHEDLDTVSLCGDDLDQLTQNVLESHEFIEHGEEVLDTPELEGQPLMDHDIAELPMPPIVNGQEFPDLEAESLSQGDMDQGCTLQAAEFVIPGRVLQHLNVFSDHTDDTQTGHDVLQPQVNSPQGQTLQDTGLPTGSQHDQSRDDIIRYVYTAEPNPSFVQTDEQEQNPTSRPPPDEQDAEPCIVIQNGSARMEE